MVIYSHLEKNVKFMVLCDTACGKVADADRFYPDPNPSFDEKPDPTLKKKPDPPLEKTTRIQIIPNLTL